MANVVHNRGKAIIGSASFSWTSSTLRILLATTGYAPNADDDVVSDVTNELVGGGYVRKTLTSPDIVQDDVNDRADYRADTVTWTGLTSVQTYRWVTLFQFVTVDGDSPLLVSFDMGAAGIDLTGVTQHSLLWDAQALIGRLFSIT